MKFYILLLLFTFSTYSQTTLQTVLKGGELLMTGLTIYKTARSESLSKSANNKVVTTVCVKNKLLEKINVKFSGKDEAGAVVYKELVVPNDGKECVFEIPKGIYTYEIILSNKEIYQKGEYKFEVEITITVKKD